MSRRYLCIFAKGDAIPPARQTSWQSELASLGLVPVWTQSNLLIFASPTLPSRPLIGERGLVLGDLFGRTTSLPAEPPVNAKDPAALLTRYWGSYVAVFTDPTERVILRDPGGGLACFTTSNQMATYYASDLDLLDVACPKTHSVNWDQLSHALMYPGVRTRATALTGVGELLAGCADVPDGSNPTTHAVWTPWVFTPKPGATLPEDLTLSVGRAVERSVTAWSRVSGNILIELSGGLDSSIVAACLKGRAPPPHCANLVTADGGADERRYAEPVAEVLGVALHVLPLLSASVAIPPALSIRLPRPGVGVLQSAVDQLLAAEAQRVGSTDFFSGGGGDNVFCYLHTAAPATDALRTFGPSLAFHQALSNLSRLHDCSYWKALRLALRKFWKGTRRVPKPIGRFLNPVIAPTFQPHPWMAAPRSALPGAYEHVVALIRAQNLYDLQERTRIGPMRYPLLAQPVVEACLAVPSWMWIEGGRNRSLARDAFADRLPPLVAGRRTKGEFTGFCGEVYEAHKPVLRDLLLGGRLAEHQLVDTAAIDSYLNSPVPPRDIAFCQLLDLAGIEAWCRQW